MKRFLFILFVFIPIFAFSNPLNELTNDEIIESWVKDKEELVQCYEELDKTLEEQKDYLNTIHSLNDQIIKKNNEIIELNNKILEKNIEIEKLNKNLIEKNNEIKEKNNKIRELYKDKILEQPLPKFMITGQLGIGIDPLIPEFFIHTSINGKFNLKNWLYVFTDIDFYPRWQSFTLGQSFPFFLSVGIGFRLNSYF